VGRSISRIDTTTPHSLHDARPRWLIVGNVTASDDCESLARASAVASGVPAYDAGIERKVATTPDATNKQTDIPAIHTRGRADSFEPDRMAISFFPSSCARRREGYSRRARRAAPDAQ
jgi:hypothetical protein